MSVVRFLALLVVCAFGLVTSAYAQCGILLQDEVPPSDGAGYRSLFEWDFDGPGPLEPELLLGGDMGRILAFNGTRWRQVGARLSGTVWNQDPNDPNIAQFIEFRDELYALATIRTSSSIYQSRLFRWTGTQ